MLYKILSIIAKISGTLLVFLIIYFEALSKNQWPFRFLNQNLINILLIGISSVIVLIAFILLYLKNKSDKFKN